MQNEKLGMMEAWLRGLRVWDGRALWREPVLGGLVRAFPLAGTVALDILLTHLKKIGREFFPLAPIMEFNA
ncbi:MAG: hypothetical protein ACJA16_005003 [Akkermansiaceae bacterium]